MIFFRKRVFGFGALVVGLEADLMSEIWDDEEKGVFTLPLWKAGV